MIYKFEDLDDKVNLRRVNSILMEEHDSVREQLQRLPGYDPTDSHAEMVEDLINVSEQLVIEFKRLRQEVFILKMENLSDQKIVRSYPLSSPMSDFGIGFDPAGGGC